MEVDGPTSSPAPSSPPPSAPKSEPVSQPKSTSSSSPSSTSKSTSTPTSTSAGTAKTGYSDKDTFTKSPGTAKTSPSSSTTAGSAKGSSSPADAGVAKKSGGTAAKAVPKLGDDSIPVQRRTVAKDTDGKPVPDPKAQTDALDKFRKGQLGASEVLEKFGGRDKVTELMSDPAKFKALSQQDQRALVQAAYQQDLKSYGEMKERQRARETKETSIVQQSKDSDAVLKDTEALQKQYGLSASHRRDLTERAAAAMEERDNVEQANKLRAGDVARRLDDEVKAKLYSPTQRAIRAVDLATEQLSLGRGAVGAQILESEAAKARESLKGLDPKSVEAQTLGAMADNFDARVKGYRATTPNASIFGAQDLARAAADTNRRADDLERQGKKDEAKLLRAVAADSRMQAGLLAAGGVNSNVAFGQGAAKNYQAIVEASLQKKADEVGGLNNFFSGKKDALLADKTKMGAVFNELNRMMKEDGLSFDEAVNRLGDKRFGANTPGKAGGPAIPGFSLRGDAFNFLKDHPETRGLLDPFARLSEAYSRGDARGLDLARNKIVDELQGHGQWEIARKVLDDQLKNAKTPEGKEGAQALSDGERLRWWKARGGEFLGKDLPVMILSGVVSGGMGSLAGAGATALGWGSRAVKAAQIGTELGAFVPTDRVLSDVINGKKADWSPGALARDYALTVGGYGLFKAAGKGWQYFRGTTPELGGVTTEAAEQATKLEPHLTEPTATRPTVPTGPTGPTITRPTTGPRYTAPIVTRPPDLKTPGMVDDWQAALEAAKKGTLGKEVPLSEALLQRLPGWEQRATNPAYGRAMAEVTEQLQAKMANGEIKTFDQALQFMSKKTNDVARAVGRTDLAGGQDMSTYGKIRDGSLSTNMVGPYAEYAAPGRAIAGTGNEIIPGLKVGQVVDDGIPLTTFWNKRPGAGNTPFWERAPADSFPAIKGKMEEAWQKAANAKTPEELVNAVAEFHWWGAHMAPFERGSAGAMDAMTKAMLRRGGINPGAWRNGVGVDLEAFSLPRAEFMKRYPSFFKP